MKTTPKLRRMGLAFTWNFLRSAGQGLGWLVALELGVYAINHWHVLEWGK